MAGVGLSVEMASHDIMLLMTRAQRICRSLIRSASVTQIDELRRHADLLATVVKQMNDGMRDVQSLFRSSRRRRKDLPVEPILDKIYQIYKTMLDQNNVRYQKITEESVPLIANATDGVLMQVLINLFDNAAYWLETVATDEREIRVAVSGQRSELVFSDSGPGVHSDDLPYIFEPFYSGKGQEGRGLGLYIARQLLERYDYSIAMAPRHQCYLRGANFIVRFASEE